MPARVPVTAVLVAHDGSSWLPTALSALAAQTVAPARVVAVDTGSTDDSVALLHRATGTVLELPRDTAYAAAVHAAVDSVPADTRWIWLLHDDVAPDPGALSALLRAAAADPDAAVLGPKAVDWYDPRVLVEIGCTTDLLGVRDAGAEPGELDQGQHDGTRQVLAVGTAGALVRRDVWDALDGLDPDLPLREDLDLGWRATAAGHTVLVVPAARIRHARGITTGRRALQAGAPAAVDRRSAVRLLLAHARGGLFLALLLVLPLAAGVRAVALLLLRRPREALGELTALPVSPARLLAMRRLRRAGRTAPARELRALLGSTSARWRSRMSGLLESRAAGPVPSLEDLRPAPSPGLLARLRARPAALLLLVLVLVTLGAVRDLIGRGALAGGRLLPAPEGAAALWERYASTAEPALAVLAAPGTLLLGSAGLVVDLLLLASVPLAGLVACRVSGHVVDSRLLQVWVGATWALLPVATGAVATGHLGGAAVHVTLPALLLMGYRLAGADPRSSGWSATWRLGLALTPVVALAPVLWPSALLLLVVPAALRVGACSPAQRPRALRQAAAGALAAAVPVALLLPWSPALLGPGSLLHGPGRRAPGLAEQALPAWDLLLLQPGGPGTPPLLLTLPLLLAAFGGLLRTRRAQLAAAGWGLALLGLAGALLLARLRVQALPGWPGVPLEVAAAGLLLAALVGAEGLQNSLSRSSFGWRQLSAVVLVVASAAVPAACAASWVGRGADGPVQRLDPQPLPAFAAAELAATPGLRALLLEQRSDGTVGYSVTGADGPRLGDRPADADPVVRALLTSGGGPAAAAAGIAFVATDSDSLARRLDAQPGLDREPGAAPLLWRVTPPTRPHAPADDRLGTFALAAQAVAFAAVAVLAGPGLPPRRGLLREPRP